MYMSYDTGFNHKKRTSAGTSHSSVDPLGRCQRRKLTWHRILTVTILIECCLGPDKRKNLKLVESKFENFFPFLRFAHTTYEYDIRGVKFSKSGRVISKDSQLAWDAHIVSIIKRKDPTSPISVGFYLFLCHGWRIICMS